MPKQNGFDIRALISEDFLIAGAVVGALLQIANKVASFSDCKLSMNLKMRGFSVFCFPSRLVVFPFL